MTEKYVVVEMMLSMLMGVTGTFKTLVEAMKYVELEDEKLKLSKYGSNTIYQIWPLKEKTRAKKTPRKKARTKRSSKA